MPEKRSWQHRFSVKIAGRSALELFLRFLSHTTTAEAQAEAPSSCSYGCPTPGIVEKPGELPVILIPPRPAYATAEAALKCAAEKASDTYSSALPGTLWVFIAWIVRTQGKMIMRVTYLVFSPLTSARVMNLPRSARNPTLTL